MTHVLIDIRTRARHPESNGIVERWNGTVRHESEDYYGDNYLAAQRKVQQLVDESEKWSHDQRRTFEGLFAHRRVVEIAADRGAVHAQQAYTELLQRYGSEGGVYFLCALRVVWGADEPPRAIASELAARALAAGSSTSVRVLRGDETFTRWLLDEVTVQKWDRDGGTQLGSSRTNPFSRRGPEGQKIDLSHQVLENLSRLGLGLQWSQS